MTSQRQEPCPECGRDVAWLAGDLGSWLVELTTCHPEDRSYRPEAGHVKHRCGLVLPEPSAPEPSRPEPPRQTPEPMVPERRPPVIPRTAWPRYAGDIPHLAPHLDLAMARLRAWQQQRHDAPTVRTFVDPVSGLTSTLAIDRRDREREVTCPYCHDAGFIFVEEVGGLVRTGFLCSCGIREGFRIKDTDRFTAKTFEEQFGIFPAMRQSIGAQRPAAAPEPVSDPDPATDPEPAPWPDDDPTDRGLSPTTDWDDTF